MNDKPKAPSVLHMQRVLGSELAGGPLYQEKRGLLSLEIAPGGATDGATLQSDGATKRLLWAAGKVLAAAGEKPLENIVCDAVGRHSNDAEQDTNRALLGWFSNVAARHGVVSVPGIAAKFNALYASVNVGVALSISDAAPHKTQDEVIDASNAFMGRIAALCEAWHLMQMELSGEHELAFAKVQHKAGTAKGGQAVRDKKAHRDAIVKEQADQLPASDKPRNASEVARRIRVQTLAAFKAAGLPHDYNDATFDKIVRRALA